MRLLIVSDRAMLEFGLKERFEDKVEAVFPGGIDEMPDKEILSAMRDFYRWPKDLLRDHAVVRLENEVIVRPDR